MCERSSSQDKLKQGCFHPGKQNYVPEVCCYENAKCHKCQDCGCLRWTSGKQKSLEDMVVQVEKGGRWISQGNVDYIKNAHSDR